MQSTFDYIHFSFTTDPHYGNTGMQNYKKDFAKKSTYQKEIIDGAGGVKKYPSKSIFLGWIFLLYCFFFIANLVNYIIKEVLVHHGDIPGHSAKSVLRPTMYLQPRPHLPNLG